MADVAISGLTALGAAPAINDLLVVVDVSDTTQAPTGTTKKMTIANLFNAPAIASPMVTGGLTVTGAVAAITANSLSVDFSTATRIIAGGPNSSTKGTMEFWVFSTNALGTKAVTIDASANTTVFGSLDVTGNVAVNTNKFTVAASTGNTAVAGTLAVTGLITATAGFAGNVAISGGVTITGGVTMATGLAVTGGITATGGSYTSGNPTTGTAAPWKLGSRVAAAVTLVATQYIEVEVNGTLFKLATVS